MCICVHTNKIFVKLKYNTLALTKILKVKKCDKEGHIHHAYIQEGIFSGVQVHSVWRGCGGGWVSDLGQLCSGPACVCVCVWNPCPGEPWAATEIRIEPDRAENYRQKSGNLCRHDCHLLHCQSITTSTLCVRALNRHLTILSPERDDLLSLLCLYILCNKVKLLLFSLGAGGSSFMDLFMWKHVILLQQL